jgi:hypothetical protein
MNGKVMPVRGSSRTMPAMMKKACMPMMTVRPAARSLANSDRAVWAIRRPAPTIKVKAKTMTVVPSSPISVPKAAKM